MILYKSVPDYIMRTIAEDNILIKTQNQDFGNSNVYVLNESGAFLWENLAEKKSRAQLINLLVEKYDIERAQAESDVNQFLDKCISEGFVSEYK